MVLVIGGSLLLFAMRGYKVRSRVNNALWSRESLLLGNNVLLMAAMLTVLLGTLLPLVHKQLGLGSISIGAPFFNTMFSWLMAPFALLMGIGPLVRWGAIARVSSGGCWLSPAQARWRCRFCCRGGWAIRLSP